MARVHNWQLGREMPYPYEAAHPERQFAFVFNINRCIACQSCTMACKSTWTFSKGQEHMWWANVETKPYGGYPMFWDMKILQLLERANPDGVRWTGAPSADRQRPYGQFEGRTIFEAARMLTPDSARVLGYLPADEEWNSPNLYEDNPVGERGKPREFHKTGEALPEHKTWFFYLARICNHCQYPACLAACPRKAIYKRPEDGIVLIDQAECRGYRKCVEACPYKKTMYRGNTRTSEKCIACYPRVEGTDPESGGVPMETRCMAACIGQIRTQPNGYYIPPRWVPRPYLRQMFGPGVDRAIERYLNPDRELLAVLQLFRRSNRIIFRYEHQQGPKVYETDVGGRRVTIYNDTVIAYGKDDRELFRTTVE